MLYRALIFLMTVSLSAHAGEDHPLSPDERTAITRQFQDALARLSEPSPGSSTVSHSSRRGDASFFLGRFGDAVAEYQTMVKLDPGLDSSHWRLGIALFFADQPREAAAQFDKYHSYDNVDRENGIWRYLSHYRAYGSERARKELLRYEKDDREPFPMVYRLFDGTATPAEALAAIPAELPEAEREKRLFYTELYLGMLKVVEQQNSDAVRYLSRATSRQWPRRAGFGPSYMWHVGRVQLELLLKREAREGDESAADN